MIRQFFLFIVLIVYLCFALPAFGAAGTNVLFILDASGSMWGQVDGVAKIKTAREALSKLLTDIPPETNLGLLSYGLFSKDSCDDVHYVVSIGANNQKAISDFINKINPKGKTPIAGALKMAGSHLEHIKGQKHVVLISDGIETCSGDPCKIAGELAKKGINVKIHVVGFDVAAQERQQLECIARAGGGRYFNADSTTGFKEAVAAVKKEVQATKAKPKEYFRDDFDGDELADHWEVVNPDPDAFIVEDGGLIILSSGNSTHLDSGKVPNIFKLTTPLPKGDWTLSAAIDVAFQTTLERPFIGLYQDEKNYLIVQPKTQTAHGINLQMEIEAWKVSNGKKSTFTQNLIWATKKGSGVFAEEAKLQIQQPIQMRLVKQGRKYRAGIRWTVIDKETKKPKTTWVDLSEFTMLRQKGVPTVGIYQWTGSNGETNISVDWVKIEVPEK